MDGSAVKSYLSSPREPWHQAAAGGPVVKPAQPEDRGHVNVVSVEADTSRDERVRAGLH